MSVDTAKLRELWKELERSPEVPAEQCDRCGAPGGSGHNFACSERIAWLQRRSNELDSLPALADEIDRLRKLLVLIERSVGDDFCEDLECRVAFHAEKMTETEKTAHGKLSWIYRIVHSHIDSHSCYHVHDDWRKETAEVLAAIAAQPNEGK